MCATLSLPMSQWDLPSHSDSAKSSLNRSSLMARIPSKPPLSLVFAWPLQFTHNLHSSQGRLMLPLKKLRPRSRHCIPRAPQPVSSGVYHGPGPDVLVLLFWPHGPFSTLTPDQSFKTPPNLSFPDSYTFGNCLLPLGKNLTHHQGPCGPTEL